jgi:FixJ family two-component response regulator
MHAKEIYCHQDHQGFKVLRRVIFLMKGRSAQGWHQVDTFVQAKERGEAGVLLVHGQQVLVGGQEVHLLDRILQGLVSLL